MEQDREDFAIDIRVRNKSAFMMLSFQDRIIKEYLFLAMSKEKKRDFRRLTKQFSLDKEDNFTILTKMRISRSE